MYQPRRSIPPPQHLTSSRTSALNRLDLSVGRQVFPATPSAAVQGAAPVTAGGGDGDTPQQDATSDVLPNDNQAAVSSDSGAGDQAVTQSGAQAVSAGGARGEAMPAPVFVAQNAKAPIEKEAGRKKLILPSEPRLPMPNLPNMNAIRAPIVRPAPADAQTQARDIIRDTGTSPSQHHANIQSAVFRVSEATRQAQRTLVQDVDSIAANTRWSIEEMAGQIDGIVDRCAQIVGGAARRALGEIDLAVAGHEAVIRGTVVDANTDVKQQRNETSQKIVNQLTTNGSDELLAVHKQMGASFDARSGQFSTAMRNISGGAPPVAIAGPPGTKTDFKAPEKTHADQAATFDAEATRLAIMLPTSPSGAGGTGGYTDQYYIGFIAFTQAAAMADIGRQATDDWNKGIEARVSSQTSVAAKNQFLLSMLGIVAPTAGAMKADEEAFKATLDANVTGNQRQMEGANRAAVRSLKTSHFGVQNFFDPSNPKSMPAKVISGLRDNGTLIKHGLMSQAKSYEANIIASVAALAVAYPDLVDRLKEMLDGDDLMHADLMLPRIEGISETVHALLQGHLDLLRGQSHAALEQTRVGFNGQTRSLWETVDKTLANITEQKLKANFHFVMQEAMFTGNFTADHIQALEQVRGYAEKSATRLMAPISAGRAAGEQVDRAVVNQFNQSVHSEYGEHVKGVGTFKDKIGFEETPSYNSASASDGKVLHQLHARAHSDLIKAQEVVIVNLPEIKTYELLACGALAIGGALFTGGASLVVGGAAIGGAYFAYSSMSNKSAVAGALGGLDWPGALALNAIWGASGKPSPDARNRVKEKKNDDSDWDNVFDFFSTSKRTAVAAKASIVADAGWFTGINDDAIEAITKSLNDSERALLSDDQISAMDDSIRWNLTGLQEEVTLAYLDGDRTLALALRFKEAIQTARREGDAAVNNLGKVLEGLVLKEMQGPGYVGHPTPQAMQVLQDRMYVSLASRLPSSGDPARAVEYTEPAGASDLRDATPPVPPAAASSDTSTPRDEASVLREQEQLVTGLNAGYSPPDAAAVESAKAKVGAYITRDYAQFDSLYGQVFSSGQDHMLAEDIAAIDGFDELPSYQSWTGRTIRGGMIIDPVAEETKKNVTNFITHGATSVEYRQGLGGSILRTAGQGWSGTTQVEMNSVLQEVEDPRFNQAKIAYEDLLANPNADPKKLTEALTAFRAAETVRDRNLVKLANAITGDENGQMSVAEARQIVIDRIDLIAGRFEPGMVAGPGSAGQEIVESGRIGLRRGVDVATRGAGTYDEMLMQVTGSRRQSDIKTANLDRDDLGVTGSWWGETSGDQAQQLEINLEGIPESATDVIKIGTMRTRHDAVDGTGWISSMTMAGSWQKDAMHSRHARFGERARTALEYYNTKHPDAPLPLLTPDQLVPLNGDPHPVIAQYLEGEHNDLIGDGPTVDMLATESALANKSYRDEIGRQESFFTGVITAIVVAVSVLLLFVPIANAGAVAVLAALLGGAGTIAVKNGMRGNRYGWEEAAVDVGMTAIEAVTAGAGAAMGGAVKTGTPLIGKLAIMGGKLENAFGKVGAAAAREGITSAASGVATTAMNDNIWAKGFTNGMGELVKSGAKGAVTGVISGSVSEGVTKGLNARLNSVLGEGVDTAIGVSVRAGGGNVARHAMLQEALSGLAGTSLSEGASMAMDIADGKMRFNWGEIGKRLGTAGLREVLTGAARGRIQHMHRQTYKTEMAKIIQRGGDMTPSEAKFMRRLAISAGFEQYGKDEVNVHADPNKPHDKYYFTSDQAFADGVKAAAASWAALPPSIRSQVAGVSIGHLNQLHEVYQKGIGGFEGDVAELRVTLATMYPGLDPVGLIKGIEAHRKTNKADAHASRMNAQVQQGQHNRARSRVLQGVDPETRAVLKNAPVSEIAALPVTLQRDVAKILIHGGDIDAIVAKARSAGKGVDGLLLGRQIEGLLVAKSTADVDVAQARAARRKEVEAMLPKGAREQVSKLSDKDIAFLHQLTKAGDLSAAKRKNMARVLSARLTGVDAQTVIDSAIDIATTRRTAKTAHADTAARSERLKIMQHVPKELQPLMSHLPESALLKIAYAQAGQLKMSKADIATLAKSATGAQDIDMAALTHAIGQTIRNRAAADQGGFFARVSQRRAMLEFVPPQLRAMVKRTPMLTVPDELFFAYVRSLGNGEENAVTLRLGGEPVVLIRQGAPRHTLGEEGLHVVQMRDSAWAHRLADIDEERLEAWPMMPAAEKARLARLMIEAEIAAQLYMQGDLDIRLARVRDTGAKARLASRQDMLTARIETLQRRAIELASLSPQAFAAMDKGRLAMPDWLVRPARLFHEETTSKTTDTDVNQQRVETLEATPTALTPDNVMVRASQIKLPDNVTNSDHFHDALKAAVVAADPAHLVILNDVVTLMDKVTGHHKTNAQIYVDGLTALVKTIGDGVSPEAQTALKGMLGKTNDHATFLLLSFAKLHENNVLGWFGVKNQPDAGAAVLTYLNGYMTHLSEKADSAGGFPRSLLKMIEGVHQRTGDAPFDGFWPAFTAVLHHSADTPYRTLRDNPVDGDVLGHFQKAALNERMGDALSQMVQSLSEAELKSALIDNFSERFRPPIKPRMKYADVALPLQELAKAISGKKTSTDLVADLKNSMGLDDSDAKALISLAKFLHEIQIVPPKAQNPDHELAKSLAYSYELVQLSGFNWGVKDDVSGIQPPSKLTFDDLKTFMSVTAGGIGTGEKDFASALPLFLDILRQGDDHLAPRLFWQLKQFSHPNKGASFSIGGGDSGHVHPRVPTAVEGVSTLMLSDFRAILAQGERMASLMRASVKQPDSMGMEPSRELNLTTEKDGTKVERGVEVFDIDAASNWSNLRVMLENLYAQIHGAELSDTDKNRVFVFLDETNTSRPKDANTNGSADTVVGNIQGLQLVVRSDGTHSIYVGDGITLSVKTPNSTDADSAVSDKKTNSKTEEPTIKMEVKGGESYPALINSILTDVLASKASPGTDVISLLTTALTNNSNLDATQLDPRLLSNLKLLKTIVAGSEVLRDDMAVPALLLGLYAMQTVQSSKSDTYNGALIYPSQILFGHNFFRRTRISAFASHLQYHTYDKNMSDAGLDNNEIKLMEGILKTNLRRNQLLGGGLFVSSAPLFLDHRLAARKLAEGKMGRDDVGANADVVFGIVNRYNALVDLALQRYLIEQQGDNSSNMVDINNMTEQERAAAIAAIIDEMIGKVLPELNLDTDTADGS